ncbi:MAG: DMT family transporter [Clostridiales bacterium]|nr:DMT family transporter [Clostridiales bacterium]
MKLKNALMLFCAAAIFGTTFVAQDVAGELIGFFTFNAVRCTVGCIFLIPCIVIIDCINKKNSKKKNNDAIIKVNGKITKQLIVGGVCCGIALFAAINLQQLGIGYTTAGKAGFITALYIVIVPLLKIFLKQRVKLFIWISVVLAVAGFYFLSITDGFSIEKGDLFVLLCAIVFAVHIILIDYFAPRVDGVRMSWIQFVVCAILSAICMFIFEKPDIHIILTAWKPILYSGICSCGIAYTLQILGQKGSDPTISSMIMSLESVISVLAGWAILKQALSVREIIGCILVFVAIIIAQLPDKKKKELKNENS